MAETISTFYTTPGKGYCKVKMKTPSHLYIEYYDNTNRAFFVEDYYDKSIQYVEAIAEDWTLGYHQIGESYELSV